MATRAEPSGEWISGEDKINLEPYNTDLLLEMNYVITAGHNVSLSIWTVDKWLVMDQLRPTSWAHLHKGVAANSGSHVVQVLAVCKEVCQGSLPASWRSGNPKCYKGGCIGVQI